SRPGLNLPLLAAAGCALAAAGVYALHAAGILPVPGLTRIELISEDVRFKLRGARPLDDADITIIALDEATRTRAPDIFQPRAGRARVLAALADYRPAAVGIDGYFAAPEIILPAEVVAKVRAARDAMAAEPATPAQAAVLAALDAVVDETRGDDKLAAAGARVGSVGLRLAPCCD